MAGDHRYVHTELVHTELVHTQAARGEGDERVG